MVRCEVTGLLKLGRVSLPGFEIRSCLYFPIILSMSWKMVDGAKCSSMMHPGNFGYSFSNANAMPDPASCAFTAYELWTSRCLANSRLNPPVFVGVAGAAILSSSRLVAPISPIALGVSSESKDKLGIWTSLIYSQALGYTLWAHYGQGVWAHLSFMLPVDIASGDNPCGDNTRRLMLASAPVFALAIKFSYDLEKITGGEGFSTCYSNGDSELQRFNPYIEVNPCSPSISCRKRAFFHTSS